MPHLCKRGTTARIVDNVGHDALDVAIAFGVVERSETSSALTVMGVGDEDRARTLSLSANDTSHGERRVLYHAKKRQPRKNGKEETPQ